MNRISEIIAVTHAVRHHNEYGHPKAIARARGTAARNGGPARTPPAAVPEGSDVP